MGRFAMVWEPYFLTLLCIGKIRCGFILSRGVSRAGLAAAVWLWSRLSPQCLGRCETTGYSNLPDPQDDICRRNRIKPPPFESGSSALTWESTASA